MPKVVSNPFVDFRKNITALDAATQANLSRSRFLHLFPQECGRTFGAYLRELRIAESCKLLQNKALTIDEIALKVGFCSQSHFTSVFRSKMKVTPNYYRRISTKEDIFQPQADLPENIQGNNM
jgi:AraC-like DNA-binding protein